MYAPEMVQELLVSVSEEIDKLQGIIAEAQSEKDSLDIKMKELARQFRYIQDWANVFDQAEKDEKKMILARIIKKITVNKNYEIVIHFFLTLDDFRKVLGEDTEWMVTIAQVDNAGKL